MLQLQTSFEDREQYVSYLRATFATAAARSPEISPIPGGRVAALKRLAQIDPARYGASRNMLDGAVTHLSPYLRHGLLSLAEVRRELLKLDQGEKAHKLLQELAWRDYYQRVYARLGEGIWKDIEGYKTGIASYRSELPAEISSGTTGLVCIDSFARDLRENGYLHNHARMWTAAYVVHHRRVRWQAGARWFLQHLLDGDPASNNLSWQWVASTFAAKPYYFNQENLAHYTEGTYCQRCPLNEQGCPFAGSYDTLAKRLFGDQQTTENRALDASPLSVQLTGMEERPEQDTEPPHTTQEQVLIWIHDECLHSPALTAHPDAQAIFVFDEEALEKAEWSLKRIAFLYESLLEIPHIQIYSGSPVEILTTLQRQISEQTGQIVTIATMSAVSPYLRLQMRELEQSAPLSRYPVEAFAPIPSIQDLRRFSRYWNRAQQAVFSHTDLKRQEWKLGR